MATQDHIQGQHDDGGDNDRSTTPIDAIDNIVKPFILEQSNFRGRVIQLGAVLDEILGAHDYPEPIAQMVGETIVLAVLLSSMLKYEGVFTLQAQGDGVLAMLVADVTSDGKIRACASYDPEEMTVLDEKKPQGNAARLANGTGDGLRHYMGEGYLAFTVDQTIEGAERYQGIVSLYGESLLESVQHYFTQSEQIGTGIKMAVGRFGAKGGWRAGGVMLQKMPEQDSVRFQSNQANLDEDDWRRSMIFLESCTRDELLDPDIDADELLLRLFSEEGVRVFDPRALMHQCRCSEDRVMSVLAMLSADDRSFMKQEDGKISMKCEFCSREYLFEAEAVENKIADYQK